MLRTLCVRCTLPIMRPAMTQLQQHPRNPYVSLSIYIITCLLYYSPHLQIDENDFTAFGNISMTKQVGSAQRIPSQTGRERQGTYEMVGCQSSCLSKPFPHGP